MVQFVQSIRKSEREWTKGSKNGKPFHRPKDMDVDKRGPLGNAEARAVQDIRKSEELRKGVKSIRVFTRQLPAPKIELIVKNFLMASFHNTSNSIIACSAV